MRHGWTGPVAGCRCRPLVGWSRGPEVDGSPPPAVYFLSDYGSTDEVVGVVHAVLHRLAPTVPVIDLSHQVPPFDVGSGASMLVRSAPYLGAGVVLAVVDPGVGTDRRAVAIGTTTGPSGGQGVPAGLGASDRPHWLVGPDNGLLIPIAAALGGVDTVVALLPPSRWRGATGPEPGPADHGGPSFDGRDLFAPAVGHLVLGGDPAAIGPVVGPGSLVAGAAPVTGDEHGVEAGASRSDVHTSVAWIDRFGNVQLRLRPQVLDDGGLLVGDRAWVSVADGPGPAGSGRAGGTGGGSAPMVTVRRVSSFGALGTGEMGLMADANGRMALVRNQSSAAHRLALSGPGHRVRIWWHRTEGPRR